MKATYKQIQNYVKLTYGFIPKTCWIADVKDKAGLQVKRAPNRVDDARKYPCPKEKEFAILDALRHYGMIEK